MTLSCFQSRVSLTPQPAGPDDPDKLHRDPDWPGGPAAGGGGQEDTTQTVAAAGCQGGQTRPGGTESSADQAAERVQDSAQGR